MDGVVVNTMTYDNYGNILSKNGKTYTYGDSVWKDLLTSYDGLSIVYDAQGNPTSYLGHTLTWEKGRQLKSFDSNTYIYNANGIRTSKTVTGVTHNYMLDGCKILRETWGSNTLVPLYDNEESVCGILYNSTPYYFVKNQQGDVISITNQDAEIVAKYSYDAWGVCTITQDTSTVGIASINPYRYRGYYFDSEIGMYYLQSRYYNPVVGRFINADDLVHLGIGGAVISYNLFTYCENDPVKNIDSTGCFIQAIFGAIVGAVMAAVTYWLEYKLGMRNWNVWHLVGHIALSAALGALGGYIRAWATFAYLAKHARGIRITSKLLYNVIIWASKGINFVINSIAKSFTRKPGESWWGAVKRWFGW